MSPEVSPQLIYIDGNPEERALEGVLGEYRTNAPTILGKDRMVARVALRLGLHSTLRHRSVSEEGCLNMRPQLVIAFRDAQSVGAARERGIAVRDERVISDRPLMGKSEPAREDRMCLGCREWFDSALSDFWYVDGRGFWLCHGCKHR